jgi:hypothetical protein
MNRIWNRSHRPRPIARPRPSCRLALEALEDRCVPAATFTVNSAADIAAPPAGTVTLRSAILAANAAAGADTINFDASLTGQTITLTSNLPAITSPLTITGLGQDALTISGNFSFRIIDVAAGVTASVTDLTLRAGSSGGAGTQGGAVRNLGGNLTLDNVIVTLSVANADGGGIFNGAGGTTTISNSKLRNNQAIATATSSGGALATDSGTVTINTTSISNNTSVFGGGLECFGTGTLILNRDTVSENTAQGGPGGGIRSVGTSVQMTDCTIADNLCTGGQGGGGVSIGAGTLTSVNCTIAHNIDLTNTATSAGGISLAAGATAAVTNTVVSHNFTVPAAQNERNTTVGFTDTTSVYSDSVLVGDLRDNGGPTLTMVPLAGSGLVDAGTNLATAPPTDQRGFLRQVGTKIDIGAYEFQPPTVSVALTGTPASPIAFHRTVTLTATVTVAAASPAPNNPVTGTVTFLVNGTTVLGTATLDATGKATLTTTSALPLPVGSDQVTVRYNGDSNYSPGASAPLAYTVARPIPTPAVFDPATATWYIRNSFSGGPPSITAFQFGSPGDMPIMGDWTGSGVFGIGVFTPATATFHLRNTASAGPADFTFAFGPAGIGVPVAGDWDGDGVWSIGVFAPSRGDWNLRNENSSGLPDAGSFLFGSVGSKPVVGDWTGSGQFSQGVVEPDGTWKLKNVKATGTPDFTFAFGSPGDQVVAGDWNGDGTWTPGVLEDNGSGGLSWKLRNSNSAGPPDITPFNYGATSFLGVVGDPDFPTMPQFAAGGQGSGAASITPGELQDAFQGALARLQQAGVSADTLARLSSATALLQPLAPGQLGGALPQSNTILLSPDGAGHGWFVDSTPMQDEEFAAGVAFPGSPAAGREDLLTTVMHELGHLAGLPDDNGSALMNDALPEGTRRLEALSAVFAGSAPVGSLLP